MNIDQRVQRLQPDELRTSATKLLTATEDPVTLVASLLRQIRENDDRQEAIRVGYSRSCEFEREIHEAQLDEEHLHIARAIEREARNPRPLGRQQLTYAGGLRRAARIARGYR